MEKPKKLLADLRKLLPIELKLKELLHRFTQEPYCVETSNKPLKAGHR